MGIYHLLNSAAVGGAAPTATNCGDWIIPLGKTAKIPWFHQTTKQYNMMDYRYLFPSKKTVMIALDPKI